MVFQKRLYYGFNGSQAPPIPRGARSHRRRGPLRKKVVDNEMCPFDLLATIADKILIEEQSPTTGSSDGTKTLGTVKKEPQLDEQCNMEIVLGGFSSGSGSAITNSGCTDKNGFDEKMPLNDSCPVKKLEGCSSAYTVFGVSLFEKTKLEAPYGLGSDTCSSGDVQVHGNHGFPSSCRNNVKVVSKDDEDNSSEYTKRTKVNNICDKRIRRLVPAKPKSRDFSDSGLYQRGLKCQRSQRMYPFKKRKLHYSSPSTSDDMNRCEFEKKADISSSDLLQSRHGATSGLSEATGKTTLFTPRESHVKLRIKSFRVPELFIELPETATVGSLKKTVMDAIKTLLGGGLHIGVLVQGRKIKDDNTTLLQSGISRGNKLESLGFTLEPNSSLVQKPIFSKEPLSSSYAEILSEKVVHDSKALVAVPESNVQALTLFPRPPVQKSKRSETGQRRIRRPFSVSEVEALVEAVEELGTGRWRDVKMRAFDNINHRTYVDLKDKWKTLVHTARISPQQRRGEPVPQELLDRVLAAHSYWSHHQAKHHPDTCLLA